MRAVVFAIYRNHFGPGLGNRLHYQTPACHEDFFIRQADPLFCPNRCVSCLKPCHSYDGRHDKVHFTRSRGRYSGLRASRQFRPFDARASPPL